jgi:hypothetical protein
MSKVLKTAKRDLSQFYHLKEEGEHTLSISADPQSIPIAFISVYPDLPEVITLSLAIDLNNATIGAHMAALLSRVAYVEIGEDFYFDDKTGDIFYGTDAKVRSELDVILNLEEVLPINELPF